MEILKHNTKEAKTVVSFIYIMMCLAALMPVQDYVGYRIMSADVLDEENLGNLYVFMAWADQLKYVYYGVYLISIIVFIRWFYRAYVNLKVKKNGVKHDVVWAVLGWFIPVYCLFRPYQIMKELHTETDKLLEHDPGYVSKINYGLLSAWWVLWMSMYALAFFIFFIGTYSYSIESVAILTCMNIAKSLLMIPAGFLAVKVVKQYSVLELQPINHEKEKAIKKSVNTSGASEAMDDTAPAPSGVGMVK